ncbi:MAG: galactokinase [Verrucomicrobiota bacterium]
MSLIDTVTSRFEKNFGSAPEVVASAPGRVEFIGNHTDYNQGPVMGAAIDKGVVVALKRCDEAVFKFSSSTFPIAEVSDPSAPQEGSASWVNYPLGIYNVLIKRGLEPKGGFCLSVESDVPSGAGLSSSAALELATATALGEAYGIELSKKELAMVGREAENDFVGVPCGILDQGVSAHGEEGKLVHIDCRNLEFSTAELGKDLSIWIFNTHQKHSLVDSMYATRNKECFAAVEQLNAAGLDAQYLADVSPEEFEAKRDALEENARKRAEHVIYEIDRVKKVQAALEERDVEAVGRLLFESHDSSRDLFENSVPELDYLVKILRSMPGVLGARLSGGGFGGAAMALAGETFTMDYAVAVASAYRGEFGAEPEIIECRIADGARLELPVSA